MMDEKKELVPSENPNWLLEVFNYLGLARILFAIGTVGAIHCVIYSLSLPSSFFSLVDEKFLLGVAFNFTFYLTVTIFLFYCAPYLISTIISFPLMFFLAFRNFEDRRRILLRNDEYFFDTETLRPNLRLSLIVIFIGMVLYVGLEYTIYTIFVVILAVFLQFGSIRKGKYFVNTPIDQLKEKLLSDLPSLFSIVYFPIIISSAALGLARFEYVHKKIDPVLIQKNNGTDVVARIVGKTSNGIIFIESGKEEFSFLSFDFVASLNSS